jgi:hypothetical protein
MKILHCVWSPYVLLCTEEQNNVSSLPTHELFFVPLHPLRQTKWRAVQKIPSSDEFCRLKLRNQRKVNFQFQSVDYCF